MKKHVFSIKSVASQKLSRRFYAIAIFCIVAIGILVFDIKPRKEVFKEKEISRKDIYSPVDITITTDIDQKATDELIVKKLQELPTYLGKSQKINRIISENINSLIDNAKALQLEEITIEEKLKKLQQFSGVPIKDSALKALLEDENIEELKNKVNHLLADLLSFPVIKDDETIEKRDKIVVVDEADGSEKSVLAEDLILLSTIRDHVKTVESLNLIESSKVKQAILEIIASNMQANIFIDAETAKKKQDLVIEDTEPIYTQHEIKKNELIIERGRRFSKDHIAVLSQIFQADSSVQYTKAISSIIIIILIWTFITLLYFRIYEKDIYSQPKLLSLIFSSAILLAIMGKILSYYQLSVYLVPVAFGALLISLMINSRVAFISSFLMCILAGLASDAPPRVVLTYLVGCLVASLFTVRVRRRAIVLRIGIFVGLFHAASIFTFSLLLQAATLKECLISSSYGLASGFISSALVLATLPIFEYVFGLTTDISLLELSDLNHPLLKKLNEAAPGTYHHSITVGNLAEAACEAINAKSLLARIGSYYHDVGKLHMSRYFSENQPADKDEHEKLTATISKIIITNHVKEGVELARKYRLNEDIQKFIREHHGTGIIHYFYEKALEESDDFEGLKEESFRYTGPKPQSKEAAIVLLADSVEASSRALTDPTPTRLKELVHEIINNKFIDGQLDECNLSLKDLNKIAEAFLKTLLGIFHARIEYPSNEKDSKKISIEDKLKKSAE